MKQLFLTSNKLELGDPKETVRTAAGRKRCFRQAIRKNIKSEILTSEEIHQKNT
jgi:hypothetical protein